MGEEVMICYGEEVMLRYSVMQGYFYQISKRGHLRFWTFFKQISDLLKELWTFQYAAGSEVQVS